MFEIGRLYQFTLCEPRYDGDEHITSYGRVVAIEMPLIKLDRGEIVNTASRSFVSARSWSGD